MSRHPRNTHSLKVVLSELYIRWLSNDDVAHHVEEVARECLAAAKYQSPAPQKHHDPSASDVAALYEQRGSSPSPPPSPPMRQRHNMPKKVEDRTPSPVHQSTRFLGVDEMDALHRVVSPGGASPISPNVAVVRPHPVVDPHIPLAIHNQTPPSSTSPENAGGGDVLAGTARPKSPMQHVPSSGQSSGSMVLPRGPRVASQLDIPIFYRKTDGEGVVAEGPVDEIEALNVFFAIKGTAVKRRSTGGAFDIDISRTVKKNQLGPVCRDVFKLPEWLVDLLFRRVLAANNLADTTTSINYTNVKRFYDSVCAKQTPNKRLFELIKGDSRRSFLMLDDFRSAVKLLVEHHPGLEFLKQPEFQDFYTVAIRIMYQLEWKQSRRVQWVQFDNSDLPTVIRELDRTSDINQVLQYFSYEHFYVLYCRFWELDTDRDQYIALADLKNYSQASITNCILARVVAGCGRKLTSVISGRLDFENFVYFCLSEEDKKKSSSRTKQ